jgi:hypothetical protein
MVYALRSWIVKYSRLNLPWIELDAEGEDAARLRWDVGEKLPSAFGEGVAAIGLADAGIGGALDHGGGLQLEDATGDLGRGGRAGGAHLGGKARVRLWAEPIQREQDKLLHEVQVHRLHRLAGLAEALEQALEHT